MEIVFGRERYTICEQHRQGPFPWRCLDESHTDRVIEYYAYLRNRILQTIIYYAL